MVGGGSARLIHHRLPGRLPATPFLAADRRGVRGRSASVVSGASRRAVRSGPGTRAAPHLHAPRGTRQPRRGCVMAVCERLKSYLGEQGARCEIVVHPEEFSAERVAQVSHLPGRGVAKVVVVSDENGSALMAVLPAPCRVDVAALAEETGHRRMTLVHEDEMQVLFPRLRAGRPTDARAVLPGRQPPRADRHGIPGVQPPGAPIDPRVAGNAGGRSLTRKGVVREGACDGLARPQARQPARSSSSQGRPGPAARASRSAVSRSPSASGESPSWTSMKNERSSNRT